MDYYWPPSAIWVSSAFAGVRIALERLIWCGGIITLGTTYPIYTRLCTLFTIKECRRLSVYTWNLCINSLIFIPISRLEQMARDCHCIITTTRYHLCPTLGTLVDSPLIYILFTILTRPTFSQDYSISICRQVIVSS